MARQLPIGAEWIEGLGVHFRLWAPEHKKAILLLQSADSAFVSYPMQREQGGYFSLQVAEAQAGSHYFFALDGESERLADPASRFQPHGPFGPSCVIDSRYRWTDRGWKGAKIEGQIIYELHIGTFTEEGTFPAAMAKLEQLADLGITMIEVMPINDFPGHYGWGYDGVNLYAPSRIYGSPDEVKAFIDRAHQLGLAVILDVVYNHLGPAGNQLIKFSSTYFTEEKSTEWGSAIQFDEPGVREFFLSNVRYWIDEYHFDGLRVDATSCIFCSTATHVLAELTQAARQAAGNRSVVVIGENEPQNTQLLQPYEEGGYGFDALWNDDFHHAALVRLTGSREAYYFDYLGAPQEFISSFKYGFLYQGQYYHWQKKRRGVAHFSLPPAAFVLFLENHDQVANSGQSKRLHQLVDPGNFRAFSCLLLLSPNTPLLFQGQEFNSSRPFYYFADHTDELSRLVHQGRRKFLAQFPRLASAESAETIPNPADPQLFVRCKLDWKEKEENKQAYALYRDLIALRKKDPVFKKMQRLPCDGAVLSDDAFLIRYFGQGEGDRLLLINFGVEQTLLPCAEPLLAPGPSAEWSRLWSSESIAYGGEGTPTLPKSQWKIGAHSALVLQTKPARASRRFS